MKPARRRLAWLVMSIGLFAPGVAATLDTESRAGAVAAAEQFIVENRFDTARKCPDNLAELDDKRLQDMQLACQHFAASEARAFAVLETEIFWRVFFRKAPPACYEERESFRVVEVFRATYPHGPRARLKDIELFLPGDATLLRPGNAKRACAMPAA